MNTVADGDQRRAALGSAVVGTLIGGVAAFFVLRVLVRQWDEASDALRTAAWGWLVPAAVLATVGMTAIALPWRHVLALLHQRVDRPHTVTWYFLGEIGKYLPGGVWPLVGRGELARRSGLPGPEAYASVALSLGMLYLTAMFVVVCVLPVQLARSADSPSSLWILSLLVPGVVALHPAVLGWVLRRAGRVVKRAGALPVPPWRRSLALLVRYVPAWISIGLATWCVARAFDPDADVVQVVMATVLSWIVGFLVAPVPGGIGVREGAFVAAVSLTGGVAATTAVVARLIFISVDAIGAALAAVAWRRLPRAGHAVQVR